MAFPTKAVMLYDQTGPANTAVDTGGLDLSEFDSIAIHIIFSGAAAGGPLQFFVRPAGAQSAVGEYQRPGSGSVTAATAFTMAAWGLGLTAGAAFGGGGVIGEPLPVAAKITVAAQGVGITSRVIVYGRRNHRGPDASINAD